MIEVGKSSWETCDDHRPNFWICSSSIPLSEPCCATFFRKRWPEYACYGIPCDWILWQRILITGLCANTAPLAKLNSGAFPGWGSNMNSSLRAVMGHIESLVVAIIISIPVCLVSVILLFNRRMRCWSSWEKVMSDRVSFVAMITFRFASSTFVYVNTPIRKNPAQATLKAMLMLRY